MKEIHIATEDGKNAKVLLATLKSQKKKVRKITDTGEELHQEKIRKGITNPSPDTATIINGDSHLDLNSIGIPVYGTTAYHKPGSREVEGQFKVVEVVLNPDGTEKERRPYVQRKCNINDAFPVKIRKRMPAAQAFQSFVFSRQYLLVHDDGLKYEYLFNLAKSLADKKEVALLGAGPKANERLICRNGEAPYHGFLYGEVAGDKYKLYLLLARQELKLPAREPKPEKTKAENPDKKEKGKVTIVTAIDL
jgi:hypothetical protein